MTAATTFNGRTVEGVQFTILHRFCAITASGAVSPVAKEGKLIQIADVTSVSVSVFNSAGRQIGSTATPSVASTFFDTLQTTETWENIPLGGNFRYTVPATYFPCGNDIQKIQIYVLLADANILPALWSIYVIPTIN